MEVNTGKTFLAVLVLILLFAAGIYFGKRAPEENSPKPQVTLHPVRLATDEVDGYVRDPYLRALKIYEFKKGGDSGAERGREIFYYKCWFCHNDLAEGAPKLVGVYQRGTLVTGRSATDEGIKEQIREGSPGMASYKYTLSEQDIDDLVTFIREACCWKDDEPPLNPRYVAK